jgi:hypothetical protein
MIKNYLMTNETIEKRDSASTRQMRCENLSHTYICRSASAESAYASENRILDYPYSDGPINLVLNFQIHRSEEKPKQEKSRFVLDIVRVH